MEDMGSIQDRFLIQSNAIECREEFLKPTIIYPEKTGGKFDSLLVKTLP